jgi:hypothetical protein
MDHAPAPSALRHTAYCCVPIANWSNAVHSNSELAYLTRVLDYAEPGWRGRAASARTIGNAVNGDFMEERSAFDRVLARIDLLIPEGHVLESVVCTLRVRRKLTRRAQFDNAASLLLENSKWGHELIGFWPVSALERAVALRRLDVAAARPRAG